MSQLIQRKEDPDRKLTKTEAVKKFETQREKDRELITGVFRYLEHPGGTLRFRYQKYQEDGFPQYELTDGKVYKLPRMIVRHLNQNVYYRKYDHIDSKFAGTGVQMAADGRSGSSTSMYAVEKIHRCEFKSLEFLDEDIDINPSNITQVHIA